MKHSIPVWTPAVLALALLSWAACSQRGAMTAAMRQQESEMSDESTEWNDRIARWRRQHEELRAWAARDSAGGSDAAALREQLARMTAHEGDVAEFQTALDDHRARLIEASAKPNAQRAATHPERWAEHMLLKTQWGALVRSHDQVVKGMGALMDRAEAGRGAPTS